MTEEINLMQNELGGARSLFSNARINASLYVLVGILVLEGLFYGGMVIFENRVGEGADAVEQDAAALDFEIGKVESERVEAVFNQNRLNNLEILLSNHIFWSQFFEELEKFTYQGAVYNTLQVDNGTNKLILSGVVATYTDLGKLIAGLRLSPNVVQVDLQSTSLSEGAIAGYNFNLEIVIDPQILEES